MILKEELNTGLTQTLDQIRFDKKMFKAEIGAF